ncbi:MAG: sigma-70 family RNA polymerase sigma factor [Vulcanimicrobiaceae bacterium]
MSDTFQGLDDEPGIPQDACGFENFYRAHRPLVHALALKLLKNHEDASDVTQQIFLKLWHHPAAFRGGNIESWLSILSRNACIDLLRRRRPCAPVEFVDFAGVNVVECAAIATSNREWIARAIRDLPDAEYEVLVAAFWHHLSHRAIARSSDLPLGTVKTRIRSAIRKLRNRSDVVQVA